MSVNLVDHDATALAELVRKKEISSEELVKASIEAIDRVDVELGAVVHRMADEALSIARNPPEGPFSGVPMAVKDFDGMVKGHPWTASTRFLEGFVPGHDSEALARLKRAGLIFVAKTKCPELAILGTTEPEWRGPARNPWNTSHSCGGSSGGSGALVAARAVPVAHGGDGGGSLRIPGSHNGVVGLKCTRGRVPMGPDWGEGWGGFVQWGVLTRTVRDTAALIDVMAGPMPGDPYAAPPLDRPLREEVGVDPGKLRIAWSAASLYGKETHPEIRSAVQQTARWLADLGHDVHEATPTLDRHALVMGYLTQVAVGVAAEVEEMERLVGKKATAASFEPATWFLVQVGRSMPALAMQHARDAAMAAGRAMAAFHQTYDVMLTAAVAHPPVRLGELALKSSERLGLGVLRVAPSGFALRKVLEGLAETNLERTPNTQLFNQTGQPAISVPLHHTADGLPIGMQLSAPMGGEPVLVRLAAQLEAAHPWIDRKPPVIA